MAVRHRTFELDGKDYKGRGGTTRFVEVVHSKIEELGEFIESSAPWKRWRTPAGDGHNMSYDLSKLLVEKLDEMGYKVFMYGTEDRVLDLPERYENEVYDQIDWSPPPGVSQKWVFSMPSTSPEDSEEEKKREEERNKINEWGKTLEGAEIVGEEKYALVKTRVNQGIFRDELLRVYGGQCCLTGITNEELLIASHIKPWSESEDNEKLIPENGLLLNALHDKAFDRGLIALTDDYRLMVNKELSNSQNKVLYEALLKDKGEEINWPTGFKPDKKYLKWHRRKHGFEK